MTANEQVKRPARRTVARGAAWAQGAMHLALTYTYTDANGTHTVSTPASWPSMNPC